MNIEINNIAKVSNAQVCLDGITVIAGYNGTGKSTISRALYAVLSAQCNLVRRITIERNSSLQNILYMWVSNNSYDVEKFAPDLYDLDDLIYDELKEIDKPEEFTVEMLNEIIENVKPDELVIDPESVNSLYESIYREMTAPAQRYIPVIIQREFDYAFNTQINTLGEDSDGVVSFTDNDKRSYVEFKHNEIVNYEISSSNFNPIYITSHSVLDDLNNYASVRYRRSDRMDSNLISFLRKTPKHFTTEEYYRNKEQSKKFNEILGDIVTGKILVERSRIVRYSENEGMPAVELTNLASGLKPFIILKMLFDNGNLQSGGVLIFDEPEVNLHPEWQIKLAELLVLLYKELAIYVLINSHSPYFVRAIEFFSEKYEVVGKSNYYFMDSNDKKMYYTKDVNDDLSQIYRTMSEPFAEILS